tara:strand:- start:1119 stop:2069 length:951 start_codon:yes stop_codon:yes gene_type:complete
MTAMPPPPKSWFLGPEIWSNLAEHPRSSAEALRQLLTPDDSKTPRPPPGVSVAPAAAPAAPPPPVDPAMLRRRIEPPKFDVLERSIVAERRRGNVLCRREDRERKMLQMQTAQIRERDRAAAEAQALAMAAAGAGPPGGNAPAAETAGTKRKKGSDEEKPSTGKSRKAVPPADRVEVALNEEDMASWYQATVLKETHSRIKVKLLVMPREIGGSGGDGGEDEMLMIEGRKEEESVSRDGVRPVPPHDPSWAPTVGENCELLYMDGWWPVRVKKQQGSQWHVMYEAFGVQHIVGRSQLRRMVLWDAATQAWRAAAKS